MTRSTLSPGVKENVFSGRDRVVGRQPWQIKRGVQIKWDWGQWPRCWKVDRRASNTSGIIIDGMTLLIKVVIKLSQPPIHYLLDLALVVIIGLLRVAKAVIQMSWLLYTHGNLVKLQDKCICSRISSRYTVSAKTNKSESLLVEFCLNKTLQRDEEQFVNSCST